MRRPYLLCLAYIDSPVVSKIRGAAYRPFKLFVEAFPIKRVCHLTASFAVSLPCRSTGETVYSTPCLVGNTIAHRHPPPPEIGRCAPFCRRPSRYKPTILPHTKLPGSWSRLSLAVEQTSFDAIVTSSSRCPNRGRTFDQRIARKTVHYTQACGPTPDQTCIKLIDDNFISFLFSRLFSQFGTDPRGVTPSAPSSTSVETST